MARMATPVMTEMSRRFKGPPFSDPWSEVKSARRKFCAAPEGSAAGQSPQARAAIVFRPPGRERQRGHMCGLAAAVSR